MDSALAWIGQIAAWIGQWVPRWEILDPTMGAVKYVGGKRIVVCAPGIHFYWPARTTFTTYPTARQTDRLETQTLESADGKTFIVSAMIIYSVDNLGALLPTTHNAMQAVADIAMASVHDVLCKYTWDELQAMQRGKTLKTQLKNEAQAQLADYGIKVAKLQLNTLARARVIKISQSTASEEN
jgi:regulator of protease activity HflC (stomatin/prohibitin superfamily)